jgi:hypothetical protein
MISEAFIGRAGQRAEAMADHQRANQLDHQLGSELMKTLEHTDTYRDVIQPARREP